MQDSSYKNWVVENKRYLMTALRRVKEELEFYQTHRNNKRSKPNAAYCESLEVEEELRNARESLSRPSALDTLKVSLGLSNFEEKILLLCVGIELQDDFSALVKKLQGDGSLVYPSFNLAFDAFHDAHWSALAPSSPLRRWNLVHFNGGTLIAKRPLVIDEQILHFLTGFQHFGESLYPILTEVSAPESFVPSQKKLVDEINKVYGLNSRIGKTPIIQLTGKEFGDQSQIAAGVAREMKQKLFAISARNIPTNPKERNTLLHSWNREATLHQVGLLVECKEVNIQNKEFLASLLFFLENIQGLVFLKDIDLSGKLNRTILPFLIKNPTYSEQIDLWKTLLQKPDGFIEKSVLRMAGHFNLSAGSLSKIAGEVAIPNILNKSSLLNNQDIFEKQLWNICCQVTRPQTEELLQEIHPVSKWKDLILPSTQKEVLREIINQVKHKHKVYKDWGFSKKSSRGFGISVLFSGDSGTGKTMTAEVLANELELPLYRCDLSQIINKYIGETEKNLKRVFDAAENGSCILLLDEADALFSKRTEVKDSHDRFANQEVAYLLQRMESYEGLSVLTTNMISSLEPAIMRRLRFICHFHRPDFQLRKEIWENIFPKETPISKKVDYQKLAQLNIPGGNIRNIAMNAAFLAASENRAIKMSDLLRATKGEYKKMDRNLSRNEVKDWA